MRLPAALRKARAWHEDPALVAFAATALGRASVWAAAALLLPPFLRLPVLPLLALAQVLPEARISLLAIGSLWILFADVHRAAERPGVVGTLPGVLFLLAVLGAVFVGARRFQRLPPAIRRHPNVFLHALFWGGAGLAYAMSGAVALRAGTPTRVVILTAQALLPFLVWRCGYTALAAERGNAQHSRFRDHLFYWIPVWGGTLTPIGKGYDYLRQTRADTSDGIAASQLAGLKLLLLSWVWTAARLALAAGVFGERVPELPYLANSLFAVPRLAHTIENGSALSFPLAARWASIFVELLDATLNLAIWGHRTVGILRLFGFRVFRNTYKPLAAASLVDFWGRYYYYFKELLVEFFFFPVFLKRFKTRPVLRIFAATMAAATFGNLYFHVLRDFGDTVFVPASVAASRIGSRLLYCVFLGLGIFVSLLRERNRRGNPAATPGLATSVRRLRAIAGVWLFFSLLHVWSVDPVTLGFERRGRFFLSLFTP